MSTERERERERERENNHIAGLAFLAACILFLPIPAFADNLILGVPDWNQPTNYGISGYPNWCAPTSGAMVMGYWEDFLGAAGIADRQVYSSTPAYPSNAGTWQQGLWHDGTIEMGWYMDTGNWRTNGGPFPPNAGGTVFSPTDNIKTGLQLYATTAWNDPGGLNKVAFSGVSVSNDTSLNQTMWNRYMKEINAGRPVVVTLDSWVSTPQGTTTVKGQTVNLYSLGGTGAHTVAGVGYIDPTPSVFNGDERIIAQDNWPTTPQYVGVPLDSTWRLNDYVQVKSTVPTLKVEAFLKAPSECLSVDLSPDGSAIYATVTFAPNQNGFRRFDASTYAQVQDYQVGFVTWRGLVSADSASIWAADYYAGKVKQVNAADGSIMANVSTGSWSCMMTFDQARRHLYVATNNASPGAISTIKDVDTATKTVGAGATLNGATGDCLTVSPDQQYLYATSLQPGSERFYKIQCSNMSIVNSVSIAGINNPGFSLSPDGKLAYIPDVNAGKIHVLDTGTMTQTDLWDCADVRGFWVSPDGSYALATSGTDTQVNIGVYDLNARSISQTMCFTNVGSVGLNLLADPPFWDWDGNLKAVYMPIGASLGGVAVLTPEPATLSLLALGGLALLRRRGR